MGAIERLTITVPEDMAAKLKAEVAGGDYASASEIIREALRDWELKTELRRSRLEALRRDIRQGMESGEAIPAEDVFTELRGRYGKAGA